MADGGHSALEETSKKYLLLLLLSVFAGGLILSCQFVVPGVPSPTAAGTTAESAPSSPQTTVPSAVYPSPTPSVAADLKSPVEILPLAGTPYPKPSRAIDSDNVERIRRLSVWGEESFTQLAVSPDGKWMAESDSYGIRIYHLDDLSLDKSLRFVLQLKSPSDIQFLTEEDTLAVSYEDMETGEERLDILDLASLSVKRRYIGANSQHFFSPVDARLYSLMERGGEDCAVIYNLEKAPREQKVVHGDEMYEDSVYCHDASTHPVAMMPDYSGIVVQRSVSGATSDDSEGFRLVLMSMDNRRRYLSSGDPAEYLFDREVLTEFEGVVKPALYRIALSPDGETLVGVSGDDAYLWNVSDGKRIASILGAKYGSQAYESIAISPDSGLFALGENRGPVFLRRTSDGALVRIIAPPEEVKLPYSSSYPSVTSILFAPDGKTLVAGYGNGSIVKWRVSDGAQLESVIREGKRYTNLAVSPDGKTLALGVWKEITAYVELLRVDDGSRIKTLPGEAGEGLQFTEAAYDDLEFSHDGQWLAAVSDNRVSVWNVSSGVKKVWLSPVPLHSFLGKSNIIRADPHLAFSMDDQYLATEFAGGLTILWNFPRGNSRVYLNPYKANHVAFSATNLLAASEPNFPPGKEAGVVYLWPIPDKSTIHSISPESPDLASLAFSPDGTFLAVGNNTGGIELWKMPEETKARTLASPITEPGWLPAVHDIIFSPNGDLLLANYGGEIGFWKMTSASSPFLLDVPNYYASGFVSLSPDGTLLVTADETGVITIWGSEP